MNDDAGSYVEIISDGQLADAVYRSLADLGVTYEELAGQARRGRFQSNRARLVWMAIGDLGDPAEPKDPS